MATLTVYSTSDDGYIESGNAVYATMQSGSGLSVDSTLLWRTGQTLDAGTYYGFQGFLSFDTSALGSGATINSVTLDLFCPTGGDSSTTDFTTAVAEYDWSSGGLTTADWRDATALGAFTDRATRASAGISENAYNQFTDVSLGSVINKTGTTYLVLFSTRLKAGTTPTNSEQVQWEEGGAGASPSPRLTIDYTPAATTATTHPRGLRNLRSLRSLRG